MTNLCFLLFGFPGETVADALQTVTFVKDNAACISHVIPHLFSVTPYSAVAQNPAKWGLQWNGGKKYTVTEGMDRKEAKQFYKNFIARWEINETNNTAGGLKYIMPTSNNRMLFFLNTSHRPLMQQSLADVPDSGNEERIYPLIPGELTGNSDGSFLDAVDITKTLTMNRLLSRKTIPLKNIENVAFNYPTVGTP